MATLQFEVLGSTGIIYNVEFMREGSNLSAYCTCRAGEMGQYCKHRFWLLAGQTDSLASDNADEVETLLSWLPGTDVADALAELAEAERLSVVAKARLSKAKKAVAQAMRD